mgnify:FL=1
MPVIGDDRQIFKYAPDTVCLVNGIGSTSSTSLRRLVFEKFKSAGYRFATVVHSNAVVSQHTQLDEGVQIMAGAVIQAGVCIGINAIVNTRSSVDHDCIIGAHVHVAPGATLSGGVVIEDGVHIGTGSTVIQGICIGKESTVGAGAVVISHVNSNRKVVGIPAKELRDD